jgi:hypothetical protein
MQQPFNFAVQQRRKKYEVIFKRAFGQRGGEGIGIRFRSAILRKRFCAPGLFVVFHWEPSVDRQVFFDPALFFFRV